MSAQTATATSIPPPDELQRRLREFIATNFYVTDPGLLAPDAPLVENGVVDSTGILEVISFLETEYGIRIADAEMLPENLGTVARIASFVARKRAA